MKAAVYGRLSAMPADEVKDSVPQQVRDGRATVKRMCWTLVGEPFVDEAISAWDGGPGGAGRVKDRPGWSAILDLARAGEVEVVVARHVDRLLRNPQARADLRTVGLKVADHGGHVLDDFALGILAEVATKESDVRSDRQRRAEERRVDDGRPPRGGRRHFGYHSGTCCDDCRHHDVHEDEAAIVREVAERWLAGEAMRALARDLTARGVRHTSGNPFNHATLKRVLLSPRLAGIRRHNGSEVPGRWDPIVSRDLHARLVEADSRASSRRAPERYLLTGLLACGQDGCGATLNGHMHRPETRRYACLSCRRNGIAAEPVDEVVWNAALGKSWDRDRSADQRVDERLAEVEADLREARASLDELDDDYWQRRAIPKRTYTRQATRLRDRVDSLDGEAQRLRRERSRAAGYWSNLLALVDEHETATPERRRAILRGVVDRITLHPARAVGPRVDLGRVEVRWSDGIVERGDQLPPVKTEAEWLAEWQAS